jgi:hemolysin III
MSGPGREGRAKIETLGETIANTATHGLGLLLSIVGLVVLVVLAARRGTTLHVVSCSVYGATLVILYAASTLYHSLNQKYPRFRRLLRTIDHASIYLLIAGTYTPFTLLILRGAWGWSLFGVIWGLALCGVVLKAFWVDRFKILSPLIYLAMGWLVVIAIKPLLMSLPLAGFAWLMAGGVCYSGGLLFYAFDKKPHFHAVWHLCVMGGSIFHFFAILFYALPHVAG